MAIIDDAFASYFSTQRVDVVMRGAAAAAVVAAAMTADGVNARPAVKATHVAVFSVQLNMDFGRKLRICSDLN